MIVALMLSYAQFAVLLNSVGTVILQSINGFGVTKAEAATLEAFKDLPIAFVSLAVAAYMPRFGFHRSLILGQAIVAAGCIAMPLIPGFGMTKLLFVMTGVSFALVKTATYTIIGLLTADARGHAALTNRIEGLFMVGVLAGYWLFGAFIDPARPGDPAWLDVYWLLAAISGAIVILLLAARLDESGARAAGTTAIDDLKSMGSLIAKPAVMVFAAAAFLYVLVEQGVGTWLPTFNADVLKLSAQMSVQGASLFAAALAIGRLGAAPLVARIGWLKLLGLCIAGIVLVVLVVVPMAEAQAAGPVESWAALSWSGYAMPMIGLFLAPIYPTINSAILSALPRTRHSAMTGLLIAFSALGGTTGSFITGQVFAALGGVAAFRLIVVPALLLGLAIVLLDRRLRKAGLSSPKDLAVSANANQ
jgi:FHS family glucose/mannose:H+ symporter-like MFS transporter